MRARQGDRLLVHGPSVGHPDRSGTIVDVRGTDGDPPFLVRFDDGVEELVFPGPDAVVQPRTAPDDDH
ncbi:DUF1918 domain-containing protein [Spiractinospora alimapuensis]|uniref:DUF1918 domain-containing protein n=1 Tax=Spiractinospora alimapuensis TaxID=2820884 RepID=UPI001F2680CA|nr:DUF1918 domain-containing protein [Spiractinospora alimapuensis]QVQ52423.1 DUF1918 domain-containing protein [Spiractinospora alimapuensis]